jgi:Ca-activated chloride channel homolog
MRCFQFSLLVFMLLSSRVATGQVSGAAPSPTPTPTFHAAVDLVTLNAVVRDRHGRIVTNLKRDDFEVLDSGVRRPITQFRAEGAAISVALLFDASGSMQVASKIEDARRVARRFLSCLEIGRDELAVYSFDTRLRQLQPFAPYRADGSLERSLFSLKPFGMTSLNDAIAGTAREVAARPNAHRAVIVLTDGVDNDSRLTPAEVSGIASAIDVPVYILAVVSPLEHVGTATAVDSEHPLPVGELTDLARWTGGRLYVTSGAEQETAAARDIADELRHQYLIAFEPASLPGWHPLEVRARDHRLLVRARSGYFTGQSRQGNHEEDNREQ